MSAFDDMLKAKKSSAAPRTESPTSTPQSPPAAASQPLQQSSTVNHQQVVDDAVAQIKRDEEHRKERAHGCGCGTSILAIIAAVIWLAKSETGNAFGLLALLAASQEGGKEAAQEALLWMFGRLAFVVGLLGYLIGRFGFARIGK